MKKKFLSLLLAGILCASNVSATTLEQIYIPGEIKDTETLEFDHEIEEEKEEWELPEEEIIPPETPESAEPLEPLGESIGEEEILPESPGMEGGYEFEGYLPDGTPNYIWVGENPPTENSLTDFTTEEITGEFSDDERMLSNRIRNNNYLKNATKILNKNAEISTGTEPQISDGIHKTENGKLRVYRKGRYFRNGRFGLEGNVYYAEENGYLLSGWIKAAKNPSCLNSLKSSDFVWKYCDPKTYIRFEKGYKVIDGQGHYFIADESGNLAFNKAYSIGGVYHYCDKYGICNPVKLKYGDVITDGSGSSLNPWLAVNQLPDDHVVDIQTQIMDGAYSFLPKFNRNSKVEVFGFVPVQTPGGNVYGTLTDDSQKGKIGCWYRNVGTFNGRQIDIKCTITDYTFYSLGNEQEIGYFQVDMKKIGLNATNTRDISANMEFFDHITGKPVKVKGFATFADIDMRQGIEILSPVQDVFVTKDCKLYKDPSKNLFTAPWELFNTVDSDTKYQVQVNYHSYNLSYKFCSGCEHYCFTDGTAVNGESRHVWKENYTGNVNHYDIVNKEGGCLWQGWQGLYYRRMGRVSLSEPLTKTVSDTDEKDVLQNTLSNEKEAFVYKLSHYVPYEMDTFRYTSYVIHDDVHSDLSIHPESCKVLLDDGSDVTKWFSINVKKQHVSFSAKKEYLSAEGFYDKTYHFYIKVNIRQDKNLSAYEGTKYSVKNSGYVTMERLQGSEQVNSNIVETNLYLPKGEIVVTKRIRESDITWAHGNPTFLFTIKGKDTQGHIHKYQNYITFSKGNYRVDSEGYAYLDIAFSQLPLGTYEIYEQNVLRYYLVDAIPATENVAIHRGSEPVYGKNFKEITYGTADLTSDSFQAGIVFRNEKQRYDGYSHNGVITNIVPFS